MDVSRVELKFKKKKKESIISALILWWKVIVQNGSTSTETKHTLKLRG